MSDLSPVFSEWSTRVHKRIVGAAAGESLKAWLEGNDLPRLDNSTEGHAWLLLGVAEDPAMADPLASAAAQLLDLFARKDLKSGALDRLLFNLFYLCHGLKRRSILWRSLTAILEKKLIPAKNLSTNTGHHRGIGVLPAFRAAVSENQADWRLEPAWRQMLEGRPHDYLEGAPMDGFEGVLGLPKGNPVWIGWALARMADAMDKSRFREDQFHELLDRVNGRFQTADWDIPRLAVRCEWKPWAQKLVGESKNVPTIKIEDRGTIQVVHSATKVLIKLPNDLAASSVTAVRQVASDLQAADLPEPIWKDQIKLAAQSGE